MKSFFKALVQSFYDASFYRELALKGRGIGLPFIVVATLLSIVPMARTEPLDAFFKNKKEIFESLPPMAIKNGELFVDGATPLSFELFKEGQGGPAHIVIDLETKTDDIRALQAKMEAEDIVILASKHHLAIYDKTAPKVSLTSFAKTENRELSHEDWMAMNETTDLLFGSGLLALLVGAAFLSHFISAMAGGGLLKVISPFVAQPLAFQECMRLAAAAKIPVGVVALLTTPYVPLQILLWFGFASFGILATRARKRVGNGPEIS